MFDKVECLKCNGLIIVIFIGCGLVVIICFELFNKLLSFFKEVFGFGIIVGLVLVFVFNLILFEDKE